MEARALKVAFEKSDEGFFRDHPDRKARIRLPYKGEAEGEFWSLGDHERSRRRMVLWRVPKDNSWFDRLRTPLLKIPFLAFADETIEDRDDVLLPIIDTIMREAQ